MYIHHQYYNSEFTINLFSLNIVSKNNFDEEFIFNTKSLKTKEIKSRDNNLTFLLNSEVNGLLVKTKYKYIGRVHYLIWALFTMKQRMLNESLPWRI